jgi:outer membrane protein assembly complex protein YaeT
MPFPPLTYWFLCAVVAVFLGAPSAAATTIEDLPPERTYSVNQILIFGNKAIPDSQLTALLKTKARPVYQVWKKRPAFDPEVFSNDLKRLRRFYEANGYYAAAVGYDLKAGRSLLTVSIHINENRPVKVQSVRLQVDGREVPSGQSPFDRVHIKPGDVFTEKAYQESEDAVRRFFLDHGYARVKVQRRALINLTADQARVSYSVQRGPPAIFGLTKVVGVKNVEPKIVLRELTYQPGERFSESQLDKSRQRILKLGLFATVRFDPLLDAANPRVVPINLVVTEKPKHRIRIGGGYNTESQFVVDFEWSDLNWLGGGRQLSIRAEYSNIDSTLAATLKQPYLFDDPALTGVVDVREDIQQVPTYTLFATRLLPHLDYALTPNLTAYIGYRIEYAKLTAIDPSVIKALGPIRQIGFLSGPYAGFFLNTTDDPYNPRHGYSLAFNAMQGGSIFGGQFDFYRFDGEWKHYEPIGDKITLATRLRIGTGDSLGSKSDYPLFYRFYAGGEGSVRGYGYWRLGPKSTANVPLGGLSDIEGSIELRRQLWGNLGGALFLDCGQLSLHPYDLPVSNLRFGAGPALSYMTPVGPIRIDLGIPFRKPKGDQAWQVYFSIGQFF